MRYARVKSIQRPSISAATTNSFSRRTTPSFTADPSFLGEQRTHATRAITIPARRAGLSARKPGYYLLRASRGYGANTGTGAGTLQRTYLSWALAALACVATVFLLWPVRSGSVLDLFWPPEPGADPEWDAVRTGRTVITYWDRAQGHEFEMHKGLIDEFNSSQDEIFVHVISIGWRIEKLLTAISSGAPPDVCSMDGQAFSQLAPQGCFIPLDDWMATQPNMRREDFFPHMYDGAFMNGHMYAIPTTTDVYCLLWNKAAFRKVGLDPERPPQTMRELEEYAQKLTVRGPSGGIDQIGFLPWLPWDFTYMWGRFFGGQWFDADHSVVVAAQDANVVKSLEWQRSWV
ncbi:MAG: extracellular solute-binding protein, partial [Candidatus Hydrogenedentes bacterium]|nr:extracellular solute-binding protein [Candidatus Hydrogenedentota bacterium]